MKTRVYDGKVSDDYGLLQWRRNLAIPAFLLRLRSKFDAWLMEQAEEAGAQLITGIRVDNLVQRDGKVVGVEADGDVIEAKTVILADGVNSILAEKLGMAKRVKPTDVAVGVKELIELPKSVIEDRFQLQGNQGAACLFAGSPTDGLMGGGFLYTNENTLSLGLVCGLHHLHDAKNRCRKCWKISNNIRPLHR